MTKKDLVAELASSRGMNRREARAFVDAFVGSIERALTEGQSVTFRAFGRFDVQRRAGRRVRVPGSGQEMQLPARLTPVFRGAPTFERRLARGGPAGLTAKEPKRNKSKA